MQLTALQENKYMKARNTPLCWCHANKKKEKVRVLFTASELYSCRVLSQTSKSIWEHTKINFVCKQYFLTSYTHVRIWWIILRVILFYMESTFDFLVYLEYLKEKQPNTWHLLSFTLETFSNTFCKQNQAGENFVKRHTKHTRLCMSNLQVLCKFKLKWRTT